MEEEDEFMDEDEVFEDEEEVEEEQESEEDEDEVMDERNVHVNGDAISESPSAFLEPNLKSLSGMSGKSTGGIGLH